MAYGFDLRTLVAVVGILSILGFGASGQTKETSQTGQVCLFKVSEMHCGACAARVEKIAKNIDGVNTARVSQPKGTAEIAYDPTNTSPAAIATVITEKTGFAAEVLKERQNKKCS